MKSQNRLRGICVESSKIALLGAYVYVLTLNPPTWEITFVAPEIANRITELVGERARVDYEKPYTVLKSILGEIGIDYIDLREVFRRHPDPAELFLNGENQTHISPLGHEVLAGEIFRYMRER